MSRVSGPGRMSLILEEGLMAREMLKEWRGGGLLKGLPPPLRLLLVGIATGLLIGLPPP